MIDYIELTIPACKDTPFFEHCKPYRADLQTGTRYYYLSGKGGNRLQVWWNEGTHLFGVGGSLPKWWQGHNFAYSLQDCLNTIDALEDALQIDLREAEVDKVENGIIFPIPFSPVECIKHHCCQRGAKLEQVEKCKGRERYWLDTSTGRATAPVVIKIYDAGHRLKQTTGKGLRPSTYNPLQEYIKVEIHYNKPHLLNNGRAILLADLLREEWQDRLQYNLFEQYNRLMITKEFAPPTEKGDASAIDIVVRLLVDKVVNVEGKTLEDAGKELRAYINSLPVFTKTDKDSRKATIRKAMAKLQELPTSQYNLKERVKDALQVEFIENYPPQEQNRPACGLFGLVDR